MFGITIIEFISAITNIVSASMVILFLHRTFENIETDITNLEVTNKKLNDTIEEYKETIEKLEMENAVIKNNEPEEIIERSYEKISDKKKVQILTKENRKLHVRCDMLVEEIHKIREFPTNISHHPCI